MCNSPTGVRSISIVNQEQVSHLPFDLDFDSNQYFSLRDHHDRITYQAHKLPISKRSAFLVFNNKNEPHKSLRTDILLTKGGSTSQNNYRF